MADPVSCVDCPKCSAVRGEPCKGAELHEERVRECEQFVADAYCQNESQSGYACGRESCPFCAHLQLPQF